MSRCFSDFNRAKRPRKANGKRTYPPPFSLRLTEEERAWLRAKAGSRSIGAYIRMRVFGEDASPRKVERRQPSVDQAALAGSLGALGQSRLASNMNQIAKAAHTGALPATPELLEELRAACEDIRQMRSALIEALGIKPVGTF